jgi:hypothetical protein
MRRGPSGVDRELERNRQCCVGFVRSWRVAKRQSARGAEQNQDDDDDLYPR